MTENARTVSQHFRCGVFRVLIAHLATFGQLLAYSITVVEPGGSQVNLWWRWRDDIFHNMARWTFFIGTALYSWRGFASRTILLESFALVLISWVSSWSELTRFCVSFVSVYAFVFGLHMSLSSPFFWLWIELIVSHLHIAFRLCVGRW